MVTSENVPDCTVRPATSSDEDVTHFTTLAEIASHGLFAHLLGRRWQAILAKVAKECVEACPTAALAFKDP